MQPPPELNILILGETGVGKSTWLNGIANFLMHPTLDAALTDPQALIPTRFTMTDRSLQQRVVSMGESDNEHNNVTGQSVTQLPKTYVLKKGDTIVCLIDTPGIGDTRGVDQDKKNFESIMTHLSNLEKVHGICILLKPNDSRLNVMFRFCIKELLTHLHRDACHNMVFVFTHTRSTFYRPGDTFPVLKKLLQAEGGLNIPLNLDTVYCMDSEVVRFMAAAKSGVEHAATEMRSFGESYQKSVEETNRLLHHITTRTPHVLQNTLSLNDVRRMILTFTEPLAHVTLNAQTNLKLAQEKVKKIEETQLSKQQLQRELYVPVVDLQAVALGYPRTVCTSTSCISPRNRPESGLQYMVS
ncbi:uncharacterized protein LOC129592639 [Paramacrobiotus metropolitanus]|uniref:uncharacterized protein LOC129592639 n=1 Tax=Paramacrobiotus metropolitanus TaxID=2943436 RepID=UPI00244607F3|nr:uncharacterized protein LOC129592639 [Paramacrobiotus metropolitanus]